MRRHFAALVLSFVVVPVALFACGDDDSQPGPKDASAPEAGPVADTSVADGSADTAVDAAAVGQCTTADFDKAANANGGDLTGQTAVMITFPTSAAPAQYANRCAKVKTGTVVTFVGSFMNHPLERNGGDPGTPIPMLTSNDTDAGGLPITFATAGTFGF
jgi:hypothetical protein